MLGGGRTQGAGRRAQDAKRVARDAGRVARGAGCRTQSAWRRVQDARRDVIKKNRADFARFRQAQHPAQPPAEGNTEHQTPNTEHLHISVLL